MGITGVRPQTSPLGPAREPGPDVAKALEVCVPDFAAGNDWRSVLRAQLTLTQLS